MCKTWVDVCIYVLMLFPPAQESGVGKTCLVNRFVSDVFSEHESLTVGYVSSTDSSSTTVNCYASIHSMTARTCGRIVV